MTRVIKFRAWHKEAEIMFIVGGFNNMDFPLDHRHRYVTIAGESIGVYPKVPACPKVKDIELMQYTGLKDKNNVEVYEGDILQTYLGKAIVEWIPVGARYTIRPINKSCSPMSMGKTYTTRVVGNIYENPELLK